jgi:uncharacterized protein YegP (UPF0339 family)
MDGNGNHFEIFPERSDGHGPGAGQPTGRSCWRFQSENGQIIAIGGQSFESPSHASDAIHNLMSSINREHPHPPIIEVED